MTTVFDPALPLPGRYSGVPEADYFAATSALNSSALKPMSRSPAHCRAYLDAPSRPDTAALALGRMIHCAVLEPARFRATHAPAVDVADHPGALVSVEDYRGAARALGVKLSGTKSDLYLRIKDALSVLPPADAARYVFWDDVVGDTGGRVALPPAQWDMAQAIMAAVAGHERAGRALQGGVAEETLVWRDAATGVLCKARLDYYREDLGVVFDLKTTEDARAPAVSRDILKWGYHLSAAHYLAGLEALGLPAVGFAWVCVEKSAPYAIGLHLASPPLLDQAAHEHRALLARYAACVQSGKWPGYADDFAAIDLPRWAQDGSSTDGEGYL